MPTIWIAFLTGLTTGGLSCLAVQGGLLASTLTQDIERQLSRRQHGQAIGPPLLVDEFGEVLDRIDPVNLGFVFHGG